MCSSTVPHSSSLALTSEDASREVAAVAQAPSKFLRLFSLRCGQRWMPSLRHCSLN